MFSGPDLDVDTVELARLTENLNLQRALLRRLDELSERVRILDSTKVDAIEESETGDSWPVIKLSNGDSLRARLLVSYRPRFQKNSPNNANTARRSELMGSNRPFVPTLA